MKLKIKLLVFYSFLSTICISQNLKEGFSYLENGKYTKAALFFKEILELHPTNKTAKLCYGRAIGLGGSTKKAVEIFALLLEEYPEDFEIKLNFAESLVWNKEFKNANTYYEKLVQENSKSFPANLGYANALSNIKMYEKALIYVDKALVLAPNNKDVLTSKKYIHLGYANEYVQKNNMSAAVHLLKKNLISLPNDLETLQNLANAYIISNNLSKAKDIFQRIGMFSQNALISLNGLALVAHLNSKNKKALALSSQAMSLINIETDTTILEKTKERYAQTLIWNRKYHKAEIEIEKITKTYPNKDWIKGLKATLNMYKGNFMESIKSYNQMLVNDSISFDGNLGKANALKASKRYKKAYKTGYKALRFYNNQKDIITFLKNLDREFTPYIDTKTSYSSDNGDNEARTFYADFQIPVSTKLRLNTSYTYRTTQNNFFNQEATAHSFLSGISYLFSPSVIFNASLGATSASSSYSYTQLLADFSLNIKPYRLQNLTFGYTRKLEDFNADLINSELVQNNYFANYSFITNFNLGWFSQYYYTTQSDSNTRNLLFVSAYYKLAHSPIFKAGINYQYIGFKNQVPSTYFSPGKFNAIEFFIDLLKDENNSSSKEVYYGLNAATGFQYIENNKRQHIYRIQALLGYKFTDRISTNIFANHSNIASATVAGFTFTEIGIKFKWQLSKQPVFKKIER